MNGLFEIIGAMSQAMGTGNTTQLEYTKMAETDAQVTMNMKSYWYGGTYVDGDGKTETETGVIETDQSRITAEADKKKPDTNKMSEYNDKLTGDNTKGNMQVQQVQGITDSMNTQASTAANNTSQTVTMAQSAGQALQGLTQAISSIMIA